MGRQASCCGNSLLLSIQIGPVPGKVNATYRKDGTYSASYFRIDPLHKRDYNRQHRLLWLLGQQNPDACYAAPELQTRR